jgi:hypothetical protein
VHDRSRKLWLFSSVLVALLVAVWASPAQAQDKKVEAAAKALQKKAMDEDYLATEFAKAQEKLDKAIAACGDSKCPANMRALLRRDLGVVLIGGQISKEKGQAAFVEALKLDASIQLDPDLKTKDLEQAWDAAKKGGPAPAAAGTGGQPSGDFQHTPIAEQQVRTGVPIYAEYKGEEKIVKVVARYKGFGMPEFKVLELKKMGEGGWGAVVPCGDVQVGTFVYFLQGFDAANDPVVVAGDRNNPYKVPVKREAVAEAPRLPGQAAPTQCQDTGDCPPDFPGCKRQKPVKDKSKDEPELKTDGDECDEDTECKSNKCERKPNSSSGTCGPKAEAMPKFWVGASAGFEFSLVPSADDVCKTLPKNPADVNLPNRDKSQDGFPLNTSGYYCTRSDGSDYPLRPPSSPDENNRIALGVNDKVTGGTAPGNLRLMAQIDYAVHPNVLVGARVGVVLFTYPGKAANEDAKRFGGSPLHLEARGTYLIGRDPLTKAGLAPFVFVATGVSTFEAKVPVKVSELTTPGGSQTTTKEVDAWSITGPFFMAFGGGIRYAFQPKLAALAGLRANMAFGNAFVPSFGPEIGVHYGF